MISTLIRKSIYIYDNEMSGGGKNPDGVELTALKVMKFGPMGALPDILWDGYVDPAKLVDGALPDNLKLCVQNGDAKVLNADAPNEFKNPALAEEGAHDCAHEKLPAVALTGPLAG